MNLDKQTVTLTIDDEKFLDSSPVSLSGGLRLFEFRDGTAVGGHDSLFTAGVDNLSVTAGVER